MQKINEIGGGSEGPPAIFGAILELVLNIKSIIFHPNPVLSGIKSKVLIKGKHVYNNTPQISSSTLL